MDLQQQELKLSNNAETLLEVARRSRVSKNRYLFDAFQTDTYSHLVQAGIDIWMLSFSCQIQQTSPLFFMIEQTPVCPTLCTGVSNYCLW